MAVEVFGVICRGGGTSQLWERAASGRAAAVASGD